MAHERVEPEVQKAVENLKVCYDSYMNALGEVVDLGVVTVPALLGELSHKKANPIAKALGLLMEHPEAKVSIPRLLDWVIVQAPIRAEAREALLRAGDEVIAPLLDRVRGKALEDDDEAVRQLLDVGVELSDDAVEQLVPVLVKLLDHPNPHIRESASDAICRLGLPHGKPALGTLLNLRRNDPEEWVRASAEEAILRLDLVPPFHPFKSMGNLVNRQEG